MDTPEKPKRSWWRKKRWWAAGLLWLSVAYVLSAGPVRYAVARGWMPDASFHTFYRPVWKVALRWRLHNAWGAYHSWWHRFGERHRTKEWSDGGGIIVRSDLAPHVTGTRTVGDVCTFYTRCSVDAYSAEAEREITVENGRRAAGGVAWDGPLTLDGRPVATLPKGTRRLSIEYFDGELSVEADGEAVEVKD